MSTPNLDTFNFTNKKVVVRVDFNVPINEQGKVTDNTRITSAIPTLKTILDKGGAILLMSHWGRPQKALKENPNTSLASFTLKRITEEISSLLGKEVHFISNLEDSSSLNDWKNAPAGAVFLLENLRWYAEEEKGDKDFAKKLANLGDVYVNDAFGTAHRAHASTAVIAQYFDSSSKMFGKLMEQEIKAANEVLLNSKKPFTAIIGGAKVSDKILIIENLLSKATDIIIGGGMAYTFIKAQGGQIGSSLCEDDRLDMALSILDQANKHGVKIHLPEDSTIADNFSNDAKVSTAQSNDIPEGWMGLDIGPKAQKQFKEVLLESKTILWNGPMGVFEMENFQKGTKAIAEGVKEATDNGAYSLVGGGDSVAAVNKFGFHDDVSYVSTGGGALLEYFEGKELPGIKALLS